MAVDGPLLPAANRGGGVETEWDGDDQAWWDWYITLADNPDQSAALIDGPGLPTTPPADYDHVVAALAEPYPLSDAQLRSFREQSFVRLPNVLTPAVVHRLALHLQRLLVAQHGDNTAGRFLSLEQMWIGDPLMREVALSSRLGGLAADLLGSDVRIYHDNALSKEPGCGRTPWHHDDEHFPLASTRVVTAWMPVTAISSAMGPLSFAKGADLRSVLAGLEFDKVGSSYDAQVTRRFAAAGVQVENGPYAAGDVSFHSALCFHTAGPNRTTQPRRALATTYFADGVRVVENVTMVSGAWRDFLPGVEPGDLASSALNPIVGCRRL